MNEQTNFGLRYANPTYKLSQVPSANQAFAEKIK